MRLCGEYELDDTPRCSWVQLSVLVSTKPVGNIAGSFRQGLSQMAMDRSGIAEPWMESCRIPSGIWKRSPFFRDLRGRVQNHTYIADSKLLNRPNLEVLNRQGSEVRFISHIPANFAGKIADKYRSIARERNQWVDLVNVAPRKRRPTNGQSTVHSDLRLISMDCPYTLVVYETSAADERGEEPDQDGYNYWETLIKDKKFKKPFACEPDALRAIEELERTVPETACPTGDRD